MCAEKQGNGLLELTPQNFIHVLKKLGGLNVTTGEMIGFFKDIRTKGHPGNGRIRYIARKLAKQQMVTLVWDADRRVYLISLVNSSLFSQHK
jgi:hypothetical protein